MTDIFITTFNITICEQCNAGFDDPQFIPTQDKLKKHREETGHTMYKIEKKLLLSKGYPEKGEDINVGT